mmetsp:Transcript_58687/g.102723  ORF Transcript_58687/g.102723 Transcript_58687/m.102723 type:complete len:222 (-) Transcript_58687:89-754(-)
MVCGTLVSGTPAMQVPGKWAAEHLGTGHPHIHTGVQCFGAWADSSTSLVPPIVIPDVMSMPPEVEAAPKSPTSTSSDSVESASSAPELRKARPQTAGRAAKRQRGRERRKMYKALKRLEAGFEERAATVAAELKLVVRGTFFDVLEEDVESQVPLPVPFFETTKEIDQWRRDYRRFRMGHHQGAKGEITSLIEDHGLHRMDLRRVGVSDVQQRSPLAAPAA